MAMAVKKQLTRMARPQPFCPPNVSRAVRVQAVVKSTTQCQGCERFQAGSALVASAAALMLLSSPGDAHAMSQKVAEFGASGLVFKDTVEVTAIDDPEIDGLTLYISDFKRSIVDKLAKDFFSEPSQASLSCAVTGPVSFRQGDPAKLGGTEGSEVFSEQKGLNLFKNKTLRIRRIYDPKRNSVIYIAYSTRLSTAADDGAVSSGRYRTSICAVKLPDPVAAPPLDAMDAVNN